MERVKVHLRFRLKDWAQAKDGDQVYENLRSRDRAFSSGSGCGTWCLTGRTELKISRRLGTQGS